MDKPSMPKAFSTHHYWYSSLLKSATSAEAKLLYTYDHAFHGFSAVLSTDELQALKKSEGFVSASVSKAVTFDTTHSVNFLGLSTATGLWPASHYGKDVIIGIIDSGIWPESPSFNDDGMTEIPPGWKGICQQGPDFNSSLCNKKLIGARFFDAASRAEDPERFFISARDTNGHGTHVASIAAGNFVNNVSYFGYAPGTARGVAPRARIAAYKTGSNDADTLACIDQAVADGVHIISISLRYEAASLFDNPIATATFGAREKGIVVCKSAGNTGYSIATIRNGIPWEFVVASGTIDRWFAGTITLGNGKTITGFTMFPLRASVINLPLIYNQTLSVCNSTEVLSQSNLRRIVVCSVSDDDQTITDGTESFFFTMHYLIGSNSNVAAAVIISEDTSLLRSTYFPFPGTVISREQAVELIEYATTSGSPTATIDFQQTITGPNLPRGVAAPGLSGSSSRGPSQTYQEILKPDIMAPGVLILAAYSPIGPGPQAAHPEWSPAAIQSAMMTTANHLDATKQPIKQAGFATPSIASPLGLGRVRSVDLVCSMNFTREQIRGIIRSSYNCSRPSPDLNYPSFIALYNFDQRGVTLTKRFKRTLTNVGSGAATYRMKLEKPENSTVTVTPTTLVFGNKYEKQSYSLSIRYIGDIETGVRHGSLTWTEETGKYTVRSPIVISGGVDNYG
ncbi:hypothetical protein SASPL_157416 [Salvia splendens]|uniref:Subtilisin-like protease n=1 Tax=Salvia splendens TaxID=180675 RepID=A0A8X8VV25_SALSN|nr:hypothetical protein SASPL_157416 [Salvia splendens]